MIEWCRQIINNILSNTNYLGNSDSPNIFTNNHIRIILIFKNTTMKIRCSVRFHSHIILHEKYTLLKENCYPEKGMWI